MQKSDHAEVRDTVTSGLKQIWDTKCTLESHWQMEKTALHTSDFGF